MTENVEKVGDCDTLRGPVLHRRPAEIRSEIFTVEASDREIKLPALVVCPSGTAVEASQQEIDRVEQVPQGLNAKPASLPSVDCDVLTGVSQIAVWMGISQGQCRPRIEAKIIPTFRMNGKPTVYALKSEINSTAKAHCEQYRRRAVERLAIANAGAEEKSGVTA